MSSAGHILDAINRMKNNRKQRDKNKFKGNDFPTMYSDSSKKQQLHFKELSGKALEVEKMKVRSKMMLQKRKMLKTVVIFVCIGIVVFALFLKFVNII
ncbi:hypothetical protein NBRC110019_16160 [Neptunitalea chrysea]|uniref:Transmembrane protein n=1 Tax=Neptunitalea chrysea TaxID=1647581 RepID=A0A9W6B4H0_9FLAO|nr:hypothetical protein [Neptunitalea chrysea]GLB52576.1 hypothetical protein NBRC110019_16160 [Neptunitalea chrysea]